MGYTNVWPCPPGMKALNEELDRMRSVPSRVGPSHVEIKVVEGIMELNYREEIMWKQ